MEYCNKKALLLSQGKTEEAEALLSTLDVRVPTQPLKKRSQKPSNSAVKKPKPVKEDESEEEEDDSEEEVMSSDSDEAPEVLSNEKKIESEVSQEPVEKPKKKKLVFDSITDGAPSGDAFENDDFFGDADDASKWVKEESKEVMKLAMNESYLRSEARTELRKHRKDRKETVGGQSKMKRAKF
ncbi:hypothetical protein GEMRC1_007723 [Eukaryota sp. GEM-RC1]